MIDWWIGCSGFYYKHWIKIFYPEGLPKRRWFEFYCEHFNTLELNVTFYRFPQLKFLENWYLKSPPKFSFSVKAPRLITHYKRFKGTERMLTDFYETTGKGLKEKLGCVLFQLPPTQAYDEAKLELIMDSLDPAFNNVVEFRHMTWWNSEVYKKLSDKKIVFCGMSHPQLPEDVVQNHRTLYYRFHGVPELYRSEYKKQTLERVAGEIKKSGKTKTAFIYFNNDITAAAIKNAHQLEKISGMK